MADRAARGGGVARPLSGVMLAPAAGPGGGADWFGPGAPLPPMAPSEVKGRTWDFPFAYNQQQQKRPYEGISWATPSRSPRVRMTSMPVRDSMASTSGSRRHGGDQSMSPPGAPTASAAWAVISSSRRAQTS